MPESSGNNRQRRATRWIGKAMLAPTVIVTCGAAAAALAIIYPRYAVPAILGLAAAEFVRRTYWRR